jgi:hypothetical protein
MKRYREVGLNSLECGKSSLLGCFPDSAAVRSRPLFRPATPRVRHVLFGITLPLVANGDRRAFYREMYAATKEHFSDRKLKKATGANYVPHRESSVKEL